MQGWTIFTHSMRMVFANLAVAFRISLMLYLVQVAAGVYFSGKFGNTLLMLQSGTGIPHIPPGFWPTFALLLAVNLITSLWIAVSWHRYILLEENNGAVLPAFKGPQIMAYFGKSILLGLLLALVFIATSMIAGMILGGVAGEVGLLASSLVAFGVSIYLSYRIGLALPAAAIDRSMTFGESWNATTPAAAAIFQLAVIAIGFIVLIQLPQMFNADLNSVINLVYTYVMGWIIMMVGVSVLTTLFGIYVEGRKI